MAKLVLDLHEFFNNSREIEKNLEQVIRDAVSSRIETIEIIHGKGSGALKKRVIRFLEQKHIKQLYHRVKKDQANPGRLFVHFRH